jgi:hypothetical protein
MSSNNKTFLIENTGDANLVLDGNPIAEITGTNADDFEVIENPSSTILPSESDTFTVTFTPSGTGLRTATISVSNTDSQTNTYTFSIQGTGVKQTISIEGNGSEIVKGSETTSLSDNTDFDEYNIELTEGVENTFVIKNEGVDELILTGDPLVSISGLNSDDFTITQEPSSSVDASGQTTFKIKFLPTSVGEKTATVTILSNDLDNTPYAFKISGVGFEVESSSNRTITQLIGQVSENGFECKYGSAKVYLNKVNLRNGIVLAVTLCQNQDIVYKMFKREGLL